VNEKKVKSDQERSSVTIAAKRQGTIARKWLQKEQGYKKKTQPAKVIAKENVTASAISSSQYHNFTSLLLQTYVLLYKTLTPIVNWEFLIPGIASAEIQVTVW
jgi:hypothetical protein